jgi:hypothetical protein
MVHWNTLTPIPMEFTADVALLASENVPDPVTRLQTPVPLVGLFAFKTVLSEHKTWSSPANASEGGVSTKMVTSSERGVHVPFETVHLNTIVPGCKSVTVEEALLLSVIVPVPETRVQVPVPVVGIVAVS